MWVNLPLNTVCVYVSMCVCVCACVCARACAHVRVRVCVHKRAYTDKLHIERWRPNGWTDRDPNWYKHFIRAIGISYGSRCARIGAAQPSRASAKREKREAREYINGTWRRSRREREAGVCGARIAQGSSHVAWSKTNTFVESQTDSLR
jgi:hypothetical protein